MGDIYRIQANREIIEVKKFPFSNEPKELEDFIMKNEGILGSVALLNHQITIPGGKRIDIWGLDTIEIKPVIVELKNTPAGIEIIPQILPYYSFVKSYPDTLKLKALSDEKFSEKLKTLEVERNKIDKGFEEDPKVVLIAPNFKKDLLDVINYVNFDIELIEITRYKTEDGEFLVNITRPEVVSPASVTTRVMEDWSWEKYKNEGISEKKIDIAKGLKEHLDNIVRKENIDLQPIFRKFYIPYQSGRNNVFFLDLAYTSWTTGDISLGFILDDEPDLKATGIEIEHTRIKWFEDANHWRIFFNKSVDLSPLIPIIKKSYEYVTGVQITKE